jgi:hypothetical protein
LRGGGDLTSTFFAGFASNNSNNLITTPNKSTGIVANYPCTTPVRRNNGPKGSC